LLGLLHAAAAMFRCQKGLCGSHDRVTQSEGTDQRLTMFFATGAHRSSLQYRQKIVPIDPRTAAAQAPVRIIPILPESMVVALALTALAAERFGESILFIAHDSLGTNRHRIGHAYDCHGIGT
jgi:hypothetical protein